MKPEPRVKAKGKKENEMEKTPKIGRPTSYTPETAALICSLLAEGLSLRKICSLENMPLKTTVLNWLFYPSDFRDEFLDQYRTGRQMQAEAHADDMVDIADDSSEDEIFIEADEKSGKGAKIVFNREFVARSKLRIETRQWVATRLLPKVYGARPEEKAEHADDSTELTALCEAMAQTQTSTDN